MLVVGVLLRLQCSFSKLSTVPTSSDQSSIRIVAYSLTSGDRRFILCVQGRSCDLRISRIFVCSGLNTSRDRRAVYIESGRLPFSPLLNL